MRQPTGRESTPGVRFAITDSGLGLPVVDVTHPAFAFVCDDADLGRIAARTRKGLEQARKLPAFALRFLMRRSVIARDLQQARGRFVSGMTTYLFKIGPGNLPAGLGSKLDRTMLAGLGPVACRWRLRETANRIAEAVAPILAERPDPLVLVNLGGGVAADSFNACILLQARRPPLLAARRTEIHVLDIDEEGPAFGARAVAALGQPGAPLSDADIRFSHQSWDWADADALGRALSAISERSIVAVSSEGGLFEYASDELLSSNLRVIRRFTPDATRVVGSLVRDDEYQWLTSGDGAPAVQRRGLPSFNNLVENAGWRLESVTTLGPYHVVTLRKADSARSEQARARPLQ
jgi:hypothetical protein